MARTEIAELRETLREKDFKLKAFAVIVQDLLEHAPTNVKTRAQHGLFILAYTFTRGQRPFEFKYNGKVVRVE